MKTSSYSIISLLLCLVFACNSVKTDSALKPTKTDSKTKVDTIEIVNDSLEYKVIILEIGFNAWLQTQRPRGFYSQQFLELKNRQKVTVYNNRFMEPSKYSRDLYPFFIDYDFKTDYGYEVNYLLYHYFLFFEERYSQNLRY
jgi:hypothetical protein